MSAGAVGGFGSNPPRRAGQRGDVVLIFIVTITITITISTIAVRCVATLLTALQPVTMCSLQFLTTQRCSNCCAEPTGDETSDDIRVVQGTDERMTNCPKCKYVQTRTMYC